MRSIREHYGNQPLYRLKGFSKNDGVLGSCLFNILLDSEFAKVCYYHKSTAKQRQRFMDNARKMVGDKGARVDFLNDSFLPRSLSISSGNCCCTGIDGESQNPDDWMDGEMVVYGGHNIDGKIQAYDLLSLFNYWIDIAEAITDWGKKK